MTYDPAANSHGSWALAIDELRKRVEAGEVVERRKPPMIDVVAKAIYDVTWDDRWDDLHPNAIERAMGRKQAMAAIDAIQRCMDEIDDTR